MLRKHLKTAGFFILLASAANRTQADPKAEQVHGISLVPASAASSPIFSFSEAGSGDIPHSADTDARLAQADAHFNSGRQAYFQGDYAAAHREFDEAVNVLLTAPDSLPDHRRIERRLEDMSDLIYRFDVEKLGAGQTEDDSVFYDKAPIDEISHMTFPVDPKLRPKLEGELHRTASAIPLELADPVQSFVHYFSTPGGRETLLSGFKRAGRYRPMIERILAEEGVPQELIYLAQAESAFLPRSVSNKQAVGMWQFIAETGTTYKLFRNSSTDDRLDPEKSTRAAARYLRDLHQRYGDWYLAMAAYNCGAGAVDRAVERTGYADYWELLKRHALPRETSAYVPIIVAITIMAKNPDDYGLQSIDTDPALEYDTIHVSAKTNLNLIADATLEPVSAIRDLNPAVLGATAPEGFDVHVPKGSGESTLAALELVPAANRSAWRLHHVTADETLEAIARTYHMAPEQIVAVNSTRAAGLVEGDTLLIPAEFREDRTANAHASSSRPNARTRAASSRGVSKTTASQHAARVVASAHVAAPKRVPAQLLHRKAAVHTASARQ